MKARWGSEDVAELTDPCPGSGKAPLELRPPEPQRKTRVGKARGLCSVCFESHPLRKDGMLKLHRAYGEHIYVKP